MKQPHPNEIVNLYQKIVGRNVKGFLLLFALTLLADELISDQREAIDPKIN
jgi:hypothetical protein